MSQEYTTEAVEAMADRVLRHHHARAFDALNAAMLRAYAATLRQAARVDAWQYRQRTEEGWGEWQNIAAEHVETVRRRADCEVRGLAALEAALSAQPAADYVALLERVKVAARALVRDGQSEWYREITAQPAERQGDIGVGVDLTTEGAHVCVRQGDTIVYSQFHPAAPVGVPDGEVRLWDTQWMNIVNHDSCYRGWDKADAINHAVKMTEQAIARNVADGKLPPSRIAAAPSAPQADRRTNYVSGSVDGSGKFQLTQQDPSAPQGVDHE
jgi:hypothetical protein